MGSTRDNVFINIENRTFYIHDNIDQDSISKICYNLLYLLNEDQKKEDSQKEYKREPIKIYINSNGGQVDDMWALVDIMISSKTSIHTYCTSYSHSCGFFIFIAGEKRFITKHSKMTYHQPSWGTRGEYQFVKETVEEFDRVYLECEKFVLDRTNITKERLEEVREKKLDWTIYSEDAIKLGVATDIITEF